MLSHSATFIVTPCRCAAAASHDRRTDGRRARDDRARSPQFAFMNMERSPAPSPGGIIPLLCWKCAAPKAVQPGFTPLLHCMHWSCTETGSLALRATADPSVIKSRPIFAAQWVAWLAWIVVRPYHVYSLLLQHWLRFPADR